MIRGMACLFVLFSHLSYITWPKFYLGILGHYGVMLFFYLSGFLAYVNYTESGDYRIFTYMKSKIRKFYALYAIATLAMALIQIYKQFPLDKLIMALLLRIFMLQSWNVRLFYECELNQVDWYISVIVFCWFMQKRLITLVKKISHVATMVMITVIFLTQMLIYQIPCTYELYSFVLYVSPIRILDFILGMLCARLFILNSRSKCIQKCCLWHEVLGLIFFAVGMFVYSINDVKCAETLFVGIPTLVLIYIFADNEGFLTSLFDRKWIHIIAKHSMTIYLVHYIVIKYTIMISGKLAFGIVTQVTISLCVLIVIVYLIDNVIRRNSKWENV